MPDQINSCAADTGLERTKQAEGNLVCNTAARWAIADLAGKLAELFGELSDLERLVRLDWLFQF